jgi:hypothetical protein
MLESTAATLDSGGATPRSPACVGSAKARRQRLFAFELPADGICGPASQGAVPSWFGVGSGSELYRRIVDN